MMDFQNLIFVFTYATLQSIPAATRGKTITYTLD